MLYNTYNKFVLFTAHPIKTVILHLLEAKDLAMV